MSWTDSDDPGFYTGVGYGRVGHTSRAGADNRFVGTLPSSLPRCGEKRDDALGGYSVPGALGGVRYIDLLYPHTDGSLRYVDHTVTVAQGATGIPTTGLSLPYGAYRVVGLDAEGDPIPAPSGAEGMIAFTRDATGAPTVATTGGRPEVTFVTGTGYRLEVPGATMDHASWPTNVAYLDELAGRMCGYYDEYTHDERKPYLYITFPHINPGSSTQLAKVTYLVDRLVDIVGPLGYDLHASGPNEPGAEGSQAYLGLPDAGYADTLEAFNAAVRAGGGIPVGPEPVTILKDLGGLLAFADASGFDPATGAGKLSGHTYNGKRGDRGNTFRTMAGVRQVLDAGALTWQDVIFGEDGEALALYYQAAMSGRQTAAIWAGLAQLEEIGVPAARTVLFKPQASDGWGYAPEGAGGHPSFLVTDGGCPLPIVTVLQRAFMAYWRISGLPTVLDVGAADKNLYSALRYALDGGTTATCLTANGARIKRRIRATGGTPVIRDAAGNDLTAAGTASFLDRTYKDVGGGVYEVEAGPWPTWVEAASGVTVTAVVRPVGRRVSTGTVTFSSGTRGPSGGSPVSPQRVLAPTEYDARPTNRANNDAESASYPYSMPASVSTPGQSGHVETVTVTLPEPTALSRLDIACGIPNEETTTILEGHVDVQLEDDSWVTVLEIDQASWVISRAHGRYDGTNGYAQQVGPEPAWRWTADLDDVTVAAVRVVAEDVTRGSISDPAVNTAVVAAGGDALPEFTSLGLTLKAVAPYRTPGASDMVGVAGYLVAAP